MTVQRLCVAKSAGDSTEALFFVVGGNKLDGDIRKVTHQRVKHAHPKWELAWERHVRVWLFSMPAHTQPSKHLPLPFVQSLLHVAICCTMHKVSQLLHLVPGKYWDLIPEQKLGPKKKKTTISTNLLFWSVEVSGGLSYWHDKCQCCQCSVKYACLPVLLKSGKSHIC